MCVCVIVHGQFRVNANRSVFFNLLVLHFILLNVHCCCFFVCFFLSLCYLAELGQPSLGPHNSQRQNSYDGCGLGPVHSPCVCGGLIRTSATRTGRVERVCGEEGGGWGGGGGQRYKPDQPFSSFAHKYLCG